jgi:hypothetical protein
MIVNMYVGFSPTDGILVVPVSASLERGIAE